MDRASNKYLKCNIHFIRHVLLHNNPYNYDGIFFRRTNYAEEKGVASAKPPSPQNANNLQYCNVL